MNITANSVPSIFLKVVATIISSFALAKPPLQIAPVFNLSRDILKNSDLPFEKHAGGGPFDTYLAMNLQFDPALDLFRQIENKFRLKLINREEAHITVITPPEYLKLSENDRVGIDEINDLANSAKIQDSRFEILCLGEGSLEIDTKVEKTYFLVVQSPDLLNLRQKISHLFGSRGGTVQEFDPEHFYPHITIGYTKNDLHEKDGVVKDITSCLGRIHLN